MLNGVNIVIIVWLNSMIWFFFIIFYQAADVLLHRNQNVSFNFCSFLFGLN